MKLYGYWRSSSAWRVRIVLHWKNLPFEYVAVNLAPGAREQNAAGFSEVNPLQQVPTLEWQENVVTRRMTQSVAIAEYLEETHPVPPLLPAEPLARAQVRRAVEIVNSGIQPLQNSRILDDVRRLGGEAAVKDWTLDAIVRGLRALESHTTTCGGAFSVGDAPTLADAFLVPQLYNARRFAVDVAPFPRLLAIEARASDLPAFARAHPDRQPDAPPPAAGATR